MKYQPYVFNRKEFLDYIWKYAKMDGNKAEMKIGDILRLADAIYGYDTAEDELKKIKYENIA